MGMSHGPGERPYEGGRWTALRMAAAKPQCTKKGERKAARKVKSRRAKMVYL